MTVAFIQVISLFLETDSRFGLGEFGEVSLVRNQRHKRPEEGRMVPEWKCRGALQVRTSLHNRAAQLHT